MYGRRVVGPAEQEAEEVLGAAVLDGLVDPVAEPAHAASPQLATPRIACRFCRRDVDTYRSVVDTDEWPIMSRSDIRSADW